MKFSVIHVSNNILQRAFNEKIPMNAMKLQRILFFVSCEFAQKTGEQMFNESFQTWRYGPSLPSLHSKTSSLNGRPFEEYLTDAKGLFHIVNERKYSALTESINTIWEASKGLSHVHLSRIATKPSSAWSEVMLNVGEGAAIPLELMVEDTTYQDYLCLL